MHMTLLAYYGGPDQIMTVTSGLAGLFGLLLIFWNKMVATFFRIFRLTHSSDKTEPSKDEETTLKKSS